MPAQAQIQWLVLVGPQDYSFVLRCKCGQRIEGDGEKLWPCPKCGKKHQVWIGYEINSIESEE